MARPFRFWMTGGIAVVTAAFGGKPVMAHERQPQARASRFGVEETLSRLERRANEHGLGVFARLAQPGMNLRSAASVPGAIIVFESAAGGTPVMMRDADSRPDLPLSVTVRSNEEGQVEVLYRVLDWDGLPAEITRDMTEMPQIVDEALS